MRLNSPNDYYVVRANALEDNVRFYRVVNGKSEQLETASVKPMPPNRVAYLGSVNDDHLKVSIDSRCLST